MMLVPLVDGSGEENGALRRLVDRMGEVRVKYISWLYIHTAN